MVKVYFLSGHHYPKRLDDKILCYYMGYEIAILRENVKRQMLEQNRKIQRNQQIVCELWKSLSIRCKRLFGEYAKAYKQAKNQLRPQGISGFSIFIQLLYRLQVRYKILIKDMTYTYITDLLTLHYSLERLIVAGLLANIHVSSTIKRKSIIRKSIIPFLDGNCFDNILRNTFLNSFIDKRIKSDKLENRGYYENTYYISANYYDRDLWANTG